MRLAIRFKDLYSSIVKLEHIDSCVGLNVFSFDAHGTEQRLQSRDVSSSFSIASVWCVQVGRWSIFCRSSYLAIVLKETELVFDRYLFSCIYSLTVS